MRVFGLVLILALSLALIPGANTSTQYQHSRITTFGLTIQQKQALKEPAAPISAPSPRVEEKPTPTPVPRPEGRTGTERQDVRITFFYCLRTVEVPDDGGGYCTYTATGTAVHPGTAACQESWLGRSFVIVGEDPIRVYTCEDTGSAVQGNHVDIWFYTNGEGWFGFPLKGDGTIVWQS